MPAFIRNLHAEKEVEDRPIMERDQWIAGLMTEYRKLPIEPDTVLFIEDFSYGAAGVVSEMFRKALADPEFKDCRLVWTARDYDSAMDQFGESIKDERVWIVVRGMPDFLKVLCVAGRIYCANTLPNCYIKDEKQTVYTSLQLSLFVRNPYSKNQIRNLVQTINKTDYFLCADDGYDDTVLRKDYGVSPDKIKTIPLEELFPGYDSGVRDKVIIAINRDPKLTKNCATFANFVKRIESVAGFYDKEVYAFTGLKFWRRYKPQKDYFGIENVYCDEMDITRYIGSACILITDNSLRAIQAQRLHIPVILWRGKAFRGRLLSFFTDLYMAVNYTSIYKVFEQLFGGMGLDGRPLYFEEEPVEEDEDTNESASDEDISQDGDLGSGNGIQDTDNGTGDDADDDDDDDSQDEGEEEEELIQTEVFCKREEYPDYNRPKYLYLFRWDKTPGYPLAVAKWLEIVEDGSKEITLMFLNSGDSALYLVLRRFRKPHLIACRVGYYQSSAEERSLIVDKSEEIEDYLENVSHQYIVDEWRRLLGNVRYDRIYADKTTNFFWNTMYRYPPTDDLIIMTREEKQEMIDSAVEEYDTQKQLEKEMLEEQKRLLEEQRKMEEEQKKIEEKKQKRRRR